MVAKSVVYQYNYRSITGNWCVPHAIEICMTKYYIKKKMLRYHVNDLPTSLNAKSINKVRYVCIYTYINTYTYRNYKELDVDDPLHQTFSPSSSNPSPINIHTPIEASRFLLKSAWSRIPKTRHRWSALISVLIFWIVQNLPVTRTIQICLKELVYFSFWSSYVFNDKCLSNLEVGLVAIVKRLCHFCTVTDGEGKYNYIFY